MSISLALALATALLPVGDAIFREGGLLEDLSVLCWIFSVIAAFWTVGRARGRDGRLLAVWTGWIAALALLRELDMHILLNPQHLGDLGLRYRLDWWMNGRVSLWLKMGWIAVIAPMLGLAVYPPFRHRRLLFRLFLKGDIFTGLLVFSAVFLVIGFCVDDIMRPVRLLSRDTKQLIEETSETIGAIIYCAGMVFQWRSLVRREDFFET